MNSILLARMTLLEYSDSLWTKRDSTTPFDVSMGASDSAVVTYLIGLYILHKFHSKFPSLKGGLYRDDGLLIASNSTTRSLDKIRKDMHTFFNG